MLIIDAAKTHSCGVLSLSGLLLLILVTACSSEGGAPSIPGAVADPSAGAPASAAGNTGAIGAGTSGGIASTAGTGSNVGAAGGSGATSVAGRGGSGAAGATATTAAGSGGQPASPMGGAPGPLAGDAAPAPVMPSEAKWNDPGQMPWVPVPDDRVAEECKLDKAMLAANNGKFPSGWAVVRYGKMCHDDTRNDRATEAYSATKTLGGVVTGIASYETRMFTKSGPRTGQLLDTDLASHWLASQSYNRQALVAHVLGMVAHNSNLAWGEKTFEYDAIGSVQINTLGTMVNAAIAQDSARLGSGIQEFTRKFLFEAIGMTDSSWSGAVYAYTWSTTLHDMARLGLLLMHRGMWGGKRVLDESWVYKMTHPSFEDANTAYGYLTWMNAPTGGTGFGDMIARDTCAPPAVWSKFPHRVSDAPDCNYGMQSCEQKFDVGTWSAQGAGGQVILGHPAFDLVIVAKDIQSVDCGPPCMWSAVRPALLAHDPMFKGNEEAFCEAYAKGDYAPDIQVPFVAPADATM
jgi:hypothetical protein